MTLPFSSGGLSLNPVFVSEYADTTPNYIREITPQSTIFSGEDGVRYYIGGGVAGIGGGGNTIYMHNAETGVLAFSLSASQMQTDADAAGVTTIPINNNLGHGSFATAAAAVIPDTPYFIVIGGGAGGTSTSKRVLYYKINSSGNPEFVGGYAGRVGGLGVQFSPSNAAGDALTACGHIVTLPAGGAVNTIPYMYPIAVAYEGEGRSTVTVIPSINYIIANTPIVENIADNWLVKELSLASDFDANILDVNDGVALGSRGFFLPRPGGGGRFAMMYFKTDLDAHVAGSETTTSAYLNANAPSYQSGLMSSIDITLATDSTAFGFTPSLGPKRIAFHGIIRDLTLAQAFPFADAEEDFDGSAGSATNNYYCNPSVYPSDLEDPLAPWFLFFPRIYRSSGDRDKLGIRVCSYDPVTDIMYDLDFEKGQLYEIGTDVDSDTNPSSANVWWDRQTGRLDLLIRSTSSGKRGLIVAKFGSFSPILASVQDPGEELRVRAWGFELDGHQFYVLRCGQLGTRVYDVTTGQWSEFITDSYTTWNAEFGVFWNGYTVVGDQNSPVLWKIDPDSPTDDDDTDITRVVTGGYPVRGRDCVPCNALFLTASLANPSADPATVSLRWSDDQGKTWSAPRSITISPTDTRQDIVWRALGSMQAPGRIFEITDVGGFLRIDDAEVDDGN